MKNKKCGGKSGNETKGELNKSNRNDYDAENLDENDDFGCLRTHRCIMYYVHVYPGVN